MATFFHPDGVRRTICQTTDAARAAVRILRFRCFAAVQDGRVHSAGKRGVRRDSMLQQQYRLFAGIGDVEASDSHAFGHKNEIRQSLGPESERLQIDQPVKYAQALSVALTFVQQTEIWISEFPNRSARATRRCLVNHLAPQRARFSAIDWTAAKRMLRSNGGCLASASNRTDYGSTRRSPKRLQLPAF